MKSNAFSLILIVLLLNSSIAAGADIGTQKPGNVGLIRLISEDLSEKNRKEIKKTTNFNDLRGYVSYTNNNDSARSETKKRMAFGYLTISSNMADDDIRRYSYQLQSYLSVTSVYDMLYIDEMRAFMNINESELECRDPESAVEIGRLFGTDFMGFGKIFKLGNFFWIKTGIVNVETGKVIQNTSKIYHGKESAFLTRIIPDLAQQINRSISEHGMVAQLVPVRDQAFTASIHYSKNARKGIYELPHGKKHISANESIPMIGIEIGKRFLLKNRLGLFLPLTYSYGSVIILNPELIQLSNGNESELILKRNYYHIGVSPQLQFSIPLNKDKAFFILKAGGGANYVMFNEEERIKDKPDSRVKDAYLEKGKSVSISLDFGTGIDVMITKRVGLTALYGFKLWQPVNYKTSRDLFPQTAVRYKERFMTHSAGFQLLLR